MGLLVKDAGLWKDSEPWARHEGVWKPVDAGFVKDAGIWKEMYSGARPIEFAGSAYYGGDTLTIPEHQPGDLLVLFTGRESSAPSGTPSGWSSFGVGANTPSYGTSARRSVAGFSIVSDGLIASVTSINAYHMVVLVFRNASGIGLVSERNASATMAVYSTTFNAIGPLQEGSWVAGGYHANFLTAPSDGSLVTAHRMAVHSNGIVTSFPKTTVSWPAQPYSGGLPISLTAEILAK